MAPLISMVMEACEHLSSQGGGAGAATPGPAGSAPAAPSAAAPAVDAAAVNGAANWDLCTLAVFTCEGACVGRSLGDGCCSFDEEEVVLVNEDACHVEQQADGS